MDTETQRDESRYEISFYAGPCTQAEALVLAQAIMALPEFAAIGGGGVGTTRLGQDHAYFD